MPKFTTRCEKCGKVYESNVMSGCTHCGAPLPPEKAGILQLYRMGSPMGFAVGYKLTIDGQPVGSVDNTETVLIVVPYGTHTLRATCGMTRKCNDFVFTVTPERSVVFAKAHIRPGFWSNSIAIEESAANEMPPVS